VGGGRVRGPRVGGGRGRAARHGDGDSREDAGQGPGES
jgi:hypothetical protein